jgi:type II secretory pathway pseudopilin PulG
MPALSRSPKVEQRVRRRHIGFTKIEMLAVLAMVAILTSLILPAVLSAREASHRVQCLSNLKQIALAVHQYTVANGTYPPSDKTSFHVRLLPFLDDVRLYERFDHNQYGFEQLDLVRMRPRHLVCPSDGWALSYFAGSYAGNAGSLEPDPYMPATNRAKPFPASCYSGVIYFLGDRPVRPDSVIDGLSNTALLSETMVTPPNTERSRLWSIPEMNSLSADYLYKKCSQSVSFVDLPTTTCWADGGFGESLYDHIMTPNSRRCVNVNTSIGPHSGVVGTANCDGSVRFVMSRVDLGVWRSLGERWNSMTTDSD